MQFELKEWPKIPHLYRGWTITEKIDGSCGAIHFDDAGNFAAQSRNRMVTPEQDNHGFAKWVYDNHESLYIDLGPGVHFGEWWGYKIMRGYDCKSGEKYFSLFNTKKWSEKQNLFISSGLKVIPVLFDGTIKEQTIGGIFQFWKEILQSEGSFAKPGFMRPEGIVAFHQESLQMYKIFLEKDDKPKSQH